jgi:hypothetical protein
VRRFCLLLSVALLAGCGGDSRPRRAAGPEAAAVSPCRPGPTGECLAERLRTCRAAGAGAVHRLTYDTLPPLTVGPGGLVRVDHLGGVLVGVDSARWLACFAACPEGGPANICFPLALPLRLSWSADASCQKRARDAAPWQGRPARAVDVACQDGAASLLVVPALDGVRRDLVTAGAIDGADLLAGQDGLAVEMRVGDSVQSKLDAVADAGCDAFALPPGYRVVGGADAFGELEAAASDPAAALAAEVEKIRAAVAVRAVTRAKAELLPRFRAEKGEACRARGFDPADDARLEACAAASPETEAPFRAAVSRETARLLAERRAELDALTGRLLVAPLCRHYAGAK